MLHGALGSRGASPARARAGVRCESSSTPLCTWRDAHGERHADGDPSVEDGRRRLRVRGRVPGRRPGCDARADRWYRGVRARDEAARGLQRHRGPLGRGRLRRRRSQPGRVRRCRRRGPATSTDSPPPAARHRGRRAARAAQVVPRHAHATDEVDARPRASPPTSSSCRPRRARRGRRLPVVRRLVARHDDLVRGAVPLHRPLRRGPTTCSLRSAAHALARACSPTPPTPAALEYNTADGTLWFLHAVGRHVDRHRRPRPRSPKLRRRRSTGSSTRTRTAPASASGSTRPTACCTRAPPGWALTWMDARVDGQPVTQRAGKAVEINALWINGLADDHGSAHPPRSPHRSVAVPGRVRPRLVRRQRFARATTICSTWSARPDPTTGPMRPNQLLAVSLPHAPFHPSATAGSATSGLARACARRADGAAHVARPALALARRPGVPSGHTVAAPPSATAPTTRARCGRG